MICPTNHGLAGNVRGVVVVVVVVKEAARKVVLDVVVDVVPPAASPLAGVWIVAGPMIWSKCSPENRCWQLPKTTSFSSPVAFITAIGTIGAGPPEAA